MGSGSYSYVTYSCLSNEDEIPEGFPELPEVTCISYYDKFSII